MTGSIYNQKMLSYIFPSSFSSSGEIIFKEGDITMMKADLKYLDSHSFKNWSKNRPPDPIRVSQIAEFYRNNNTKLVPGIISIWQPSNEKENRWVYDGIHRLMAAFEYGEPMIVLLQFRFTDKEQDIIDDFIHLNKSISVPFVYIDNDQIKKRVCEKIVGDLCSRYPSFVSPSKRPNRCNFNRDLLMDFFSELDLDFQKPGIDTLIQLELEKLNLKAKEHVLKNHIAFPNKCAFHNFYLFFLEKSTMKETLENKK